MNKKLKAFDFWGHAVLVFGLAVGVIGYLRIRFDSQKAFLVIALSALYYVIWGFVYHNLKGDFNRKLLFEYLLIAGIALVASYLVIVS